MKIHPYNTSAWWEISAFIDGLTRIYNVPLSSIYVGITGDITKRRSDHGVDSRDRTFGSVVCRHVMDARAIEAELIERGCDGGPGGGDNSSVYVYAFLKPGACKAA